MRQAIRSRVLSFLISAAIVLPAAFFTTPQSLSQVKGPSDVSVQVGRLASVPLSIDGDEADYVVLGTDVDAFREYSQDPKQIKLRVIGYAPGMAYVVVASTKGGKLQPLFKVVVTVVGSQPGPPLPPSPEPSDPEVRKFASAMKLAGSGFSKWAELGGGLEACRGVAEAARTTGEFVVAAKATLKSSMGADLIPDGVKRILSDETSKNIPEEADAEWDASIRQKVKDMYKKLGAAARLAGELK